MVFERFMGGELFSCVCALNERFRGRLKGHARIPSLQANCGLIAPAHHAWASADALLQIWDYYQESPEALPPI